MKLTILTNDPSFTAWGWAVIRDGTVINVGCIKTSPENKKKRIRKSDDTIRRIQEINTELLRVIRKYHINYILSEAPHGSQNASAAVMIGVVTGIAQTISDALNIPIEFYSEEDSKKCVLNKRSATKKEMILAINKLYCVPWFDIGYKDEAVADAVAIFHTAMKFSNVLKMME